MLCAGRVIAGLCVGIASSVVPVYQAEIAPKEIRGRVVSLQQWAITWGILIQYFIQYGAAQVGGGPDDPNQPEAAFRIPWGVQMVPAFILLIGLFFFPYSPRWLATKDRWEEAIQVLARLHGDGDPNHPKVLAEYQEIEDALRFEREEATSSFRALAKPRIFKRVLLGMSVQMWSQLCGTISSLTTHSIRRRVRSNMDYRNEHYDVLHCIYHERCTDCFALGNCFDSIRHQRRHDSAGDSVSG